MPRRRPGIVRAEQETRPNRPWPLLERLHGLSARTSHQIHLIEAYSRDYYLFPGATDRALRRYRAFVSTPGRGLRYPQYAPCSCRGCAFDDVRHARDVLQSVLDQLNGRPRSELRHRVEALDERYRDRTLPCPCAPSRACGGNRWWHRRIAVGEAGGIGG